MNPKIKSLHPSLGNKSCGDILRYAAGFFINTFLGLCPPTLSPIVLRRFGATIGNGCRINRVSYINFYKNWFNNINIGNNVYIGDGTMLDLADQIVIGSNTTIAEKVLILTHTNVGYNSHPLKEILPDTYESVHINSGVFIGANSTILHGVTIGDNSIVGAMSLVRKDVEPYTIVAGIPAKVIGRTDAA